MPVDPNCVVANVLVVITPPGFSSSEVSVKVYAPFRNCVVGIL
jgi:hypothetical protein